MQCHFKFNETTFLHAVLSRPLLNESESRRHLQRQTPVIAHISPSDSAPALEVRFWRPRSTLLPPEQQQMQTGLKCASSGASEVRQRHDTDKGRGGREDYIMNFWGQRSKVLSLSLEWVTLDKSNSVSNRSAEGLLGRVWRPCEMLAQRVFNKECFICHRETLRDQ